MAMVVLFGAFMALPLARWFYEIEPVPLADAVVLGFVSLAWALVVFVVRRLESTESSDDQSSPAAGG